MVDTSQSSPTDLQLETFRRAVLALNSAVPKDGSPCAAHAAAVVDAVGDALPRNDTYQAADEPVTRYLEQCLNEMPIAFPDLAASIRDIGRQLRWQVNPNYRNVFPDYFFDNESFAEVIGPDGILISPDVRVCLFMMGKDLHYPLHNHEPSELYHVISGTASWRKGDEEWKKEPAGSAIFHDVFEGHEMRTENEPLLAIATWIGGLSDGEAKPIK